MKLTLSLIMAVLIGLCFTPAWAQDDTDDLSVGEKLQVLTLGAQAFHPAKGSDEGLDFFERREIYWDRQEGGGKPLSAVIRLPSGAKLARAQLQSFDRVSGGQTDETNVRCEIFREDWNNAHITGDAFSTRIETLESDEDNNGDGYQQTDRLLVGETIKNQDYWYQAICFLGNGDHRNRLRLYALKIYYRLQVNTNLPTAFGDIDHLPDRFQEAINALSASGVTNGCNPPAGDEFCPDAPITRGQMAVFLAEALNMYWPLSGGY